MTTEKQKPSQQPAEGVHFTFYALIGLIVLSLLLALVYVTFG